MRAVGLVAAVLSLGCLWDTDTLKEESLGQPEVAAIVGGDLHKHSPAFYRAKISYTFDLVHDHDKPPPHIDERYDDIAVAYAKLGEFTDALATLAAKDKLYPNEYTTHANRGSILAMLGDLPGALKELNAAIAQNPDAHFGRERFQVQLLEYLAKTPGLKATDNFLAIDSGSWAGDSRAIMGLEKRARDRGKPDPAIEALAGLVRFGDAQDSPYVWEALGWALVRQGDASLAIRAFRRAEILGMARAGEDGAVVASAIRANGLICCSHLADTPKLRMLWHRVSSEIDAGWGKGQAAERDRQTAEDALVGKHQYQAAFGY
jgi:tetratricopeptide (TPR) repeat protein